MDDFDDYFTDDIVFDEQAIAALDAVESQFTTQPASRPQLNHPPPPVVPPPAKRQRTAQGWAAPLAPAKKPIPRKTISVEDMDMPEISVKGPWYGIPGSQQTASSQSLAALANDSRAGVDGPSFAQVESSTPINRAIPPFRQAQPPPPSRTTGPIPRTRQPSYNNPNAVAGSSRPQPFNTVPQNRHPPLPPPRNPPNYRTSATSAQPGPSRSNSHSSAIQRSTTATPVARNTSLQPQRTIVVEDHAAKDEVAALRAQLEELQRNQKTTEASLQAALNEKRAKAGEAAILRENLEKAAEAHRLEQEKLRTAKDALEASQAEAAKRHHEEVERLKTQMIFKQHEMNTTTRLAPTSARAQRKTGVEFSPAPVPMSSQMRSWNASAGPSVCKTPSKLRFLPGSQVQAPGSPSRRKVNMPAPPDKKLPGFVNAFLPSSPGKRRESTQPAQTPRKDKGKAPATFVEATQSQWETDAVPPSPPSSPMRPPRSQRPRVQAMDIDDEDSQGGSKADVSMDVFDAETEREVKDSSRDEVTPSAWLSWLHQNIFTHVHPTSGTNTFQTLLALKVEEPNAAAYSKICNSILGALGGGSDLATVAARLSPPLVQMADVLCDQSLIIPLIALLNLLTALMVSFPDFVVALTTPPAEPTSNQSHNILSTVSKVITRYMLHAKMQGEDDAAVTNQQLAHEVFHMLDVAIWMIPREYESQLIVVPRSPGVLETLLHPSQPTWFLSSSTRTFALLSMRRSIFRHLLAFPEEMDDETQKNYEKLPQVEGMCALLLDHKRTEDEVYAMKSSILTAFTQLAMAHSDALVILSKSLSVIPSLIAFTTDLASAVWEEDEGLVSAPARLSETMRIIAHSLLLLHYIVFRSEPTVNLRETFLKASTVRRFSGLGHMFIVTLGRLSYAEAPDHISFEDKNRLEHLVEPARDIMDIVIEGPESESIWAAFQEAEDLESAVDGEELEARMLG
ncbi:hypothetical protein OF83DRAFT_708942 [Amylostereum chailletii]|nr:hypothetical protein OF83DRAFT_708942 [Amylostereum chailletii]